MGVLEQLQEQQGIMASMLQDIKSKLDAWSARRPEKWVTRTELMETYQLGRNSCQRLIDAGIRQGEVKTRTFCVRGEQPMQRIDAESFDNFLKHGGVAIN